MDRFGQGRGRRAVATDRKRRQPANRRHGAGSLHHTAATVRDEIDALNQRSAELQAILRNELAPGRLEQPVSPSLFEGSLT